MSKHVENTAKALHDRLGKLNLEDGKRMCESIKRYALSLDAKGLRYDDNQDLTAFSRQYDGRDYERWCLLQVGSAAVLFEQVDELLSVLKHRQWWHRYSKFEYEIRKGCHVSEKPDNAERNFWDEYHKIFWRNLVTDSDLGATKKGGIEGVRQCYVEKHNSIFAKFTMRTTMNGKHLSFLKMPMMDFVSAVNQLINTRDELIRQFRDCQGISAGEQSALELYLNLARLYFHWFGHSVLERTHDPNVNGLSIRQHILYHIDLHQSGRATIHQGEEWIQQIIVITDRIADVKGEIYSLSRYIKNDFEESKTISRKLSKCNQLLKAEIIKKTFEQHMKFNKHIAWINAFTGFVKREGEGLRQNFITHSTYSRYKTSLKLSSQKIADAAGDRLIPELEEVVLMLSQTVSELLDHPEVRSVRSSAASTIRTHVVSFLRRRDTQKRDAARRDSAARMIQDLYRCNPLDTRASPTSTPAGAHSPVVITNVHTMPDNTVGDFQERPNEPSRRGKRRAPTTATPAPVSPTTNGPAVTTASRVVWGCSGDRLWYYVSRQLPGIRQSTWNDRLLTNYQRLGPARDKAILSDRFKRVRLKHYTADKLALFFHVDRDNNIVVVAAAKHTRTGRRGHDNYYEGWGMPYGSEPTLHRFKADLSRR
ncbi:MAG: hypothetical protein AAF662_13995 [Pseudomonadota bacterium]